MEQQKNNEGSLLNIGIGTIDNQHKIIFDLIGDLHKAAESLAESQMTESLLQMIENNVYLHFETEEKLFEQHRDTVAHRLEHYTFLKKFHNLCRAFRNREQNFASIPNFLDTWFISHIRQLDMPLFFSMIKEGGYEEAEGTTDVYPDTPMERRWHRRICFEMLAQRNFAASCYNTSTLKNTGVIITDISLGGLRFQSAVDHAIDDLTVLTCNIEEGGTLQEKARILYSEGESYGAEFINLSPAMEIFLLEMYSKVYENDSLEYKEK